jgi:uncharacterized membrane protein YphA (DoxX/SURF4 family)
MIHQFAPWSFAQRVAFRFVSIFFLLNMFPFPANMYPDEAYMDGLTYTVWKWPTQWIATNLLHIPGEISTQVTGSGDTTFHWILFGLTIFLSLILAAIWSVVDRRRPHYEQAMAWLRVYTRYYLAYMMLLYGIIKIYHLQMPTPSVYQLSQPYGDFSPMGVLWSFIGVSKAYSAFSGWSEVIGGVLLLFRRTTLLGALVSFGVMLNVFVLNMCYDVPVKLFSFFLLLACAFLAAPDMNRLLKFFVSQEPTLPRVEWTIFNAKKWKISALVFKVLIIGWMLYSNISSCVESQKQYGDMATPFPLSGLYKVQSFERNHVEVPPLLTDSTIWHRLLVHNFPGGWGRITMNNEKLEYCTFKVDTLSHTVDLHLASDTIPNIFTYVQADSGILSIKGIWQKDSISIRLKKAENLYPLLSRGFHWVSEYPFNR